LFYILSKGALKKKEKYIKYAHFLPTILYASEADEIYTISIIIESDSKSENLLKIRDEPQKFEIFLADVKIENFRVLNKYTINLECI